MCLLLIFSFLLKISKTTFYLFQFGLLKRLKQNSTLTATIRNKLKKMGIKGLLAFIREKCPEIVQHIELSAFKGYRIAIDLAVLCYQKKSEAVSKIASKLDLVYEDIDYHYCTMFMIKRILGILENILYAGRPG